MNTITRLAPIGALLVALAACDDWTEPKAEQKTTWSNSEVAKTETYYEALREWKKTPHSIMFGWFQGWSEPGAVVGLSLDAVPDSFDIVSLWDNASGVPEARMRDLRRVQQVKGTKVVKCSFCRWVGQGYTPREHDVDEPTRNAYWGFGETRESREEAVRRYARAILDTVAFYGYDGFDIDFEPNYGAGGNLASDNGLMHVFITELATRLGPKSPNPETLLIVDGEPQTLNAESGPYLSYYVIQAYWPGNRFEGRLSELLAKFDEVETPEEITNKCVMTENLQSGADRSHIMNFARWQPQNGFRKGGIGGYQFQYLASDDYSYIRQSIQIMNPAPIGNY